MTTPRAWIFAVVCVACVTVQCDAHDASTHSQVPANATGTAPAPMAPDGSAETPTGQVPMGSPLLQETMGAIGVQNTLMESQMEAERTAHTSAQVAREQLGEIDADRAAQMEDVLESMGQ